MPSAAELLDALAARGLLAPALRERLRARAALGPDEALERLRSEGGIPAASLGPAWGDLLGFPYLDLDKTLFDPAVVGLLPEAAARRHRAILVYRLGGAVTAAMAHPEDSRAVEALRQAAGAEVSPVFAFAKEIEDAISVQYASREIVAELASRLDAGGARGAGEVLDLETLRRAAGSEAVVELVHSLLLLALKEGASDVHIEPGEFDAKVRLRVDGVLQERLRLSRSLLPPVVSRLKVLAGADITVRRRAQDGRLSLPLRSRSADFRFSSVPSIYGEKVVLRALGQASRFGVPDLASLDLSRANLALVRRIIGAPNGVFFITGPTGSGKTTTLFAALKELNKPGVNVMTIEDPVEYRLAGANQVQVDPDADLTFATALRSFLRQDPDVILVGEIRDLESAKIAAQAALTGHLVMSTMHTNNCLQAVTRLVEIGVEPFLVAPSIIGVMAQRLVRRLCPHCREEAPLSRAELERHFDAEPGAKASFWRARGCELCAGAGYKGRVAIHEVFLIDDAVRALIAKGASILDIQAAARRGGFMPMRYDGLKKVLRGLTTIEEVDEVLLAEDA